MDGATEIDMVLNIGRALSSDWAYVERDIRAVTEAAHQRHAIVKVILETDFLPDDSIKRELCKICESASADFVKTSTGFGFVKQPGGNFNYQGATEHDLVLMRASCSPAVKIKASGGVRDLASLIRVRNLGASRCGTSATKTILDEYRRTLDSGKTPLSGESAGIGGY